MTHKTLFTWLRILALNQNDFFDKTTILLRHIRILAFVESIKTTRVRTCRQKEQRIRGQISILNVMIILWFEEMISSIALVWTLKLVSSILRNMINWILFLFGFWFLIFVFVLFEHLFLSNNNWSDRLSLLKNRWISYMISISMSSCPRLFSSEILIIYQQMDIFPHLSSVYRSHRLSRLVEGTPHLLSQSSLTSVI